MLNNCVPQPFVLYLQNIYYASNMILPNHSGGVVNVAVLKHICVCVGVCVCSSGSSSLDAPVMMLHSVH